MKTNMIMQWLGVLFLLYRIWLWPPMVIVLMVWIYVGEQIRSRQSRNA